MQSWLEGRNWVGKCAQATGMTASLRIQSSKADSNTCESFTRSGLKLESVHQESPRSDIFRKRATKPLLNQEHRQKHLTWAKEKKNWTVAQWSKVLFSDKSIFFFSFGNQGLESKGRLERHRIQAAWSPVWSFHSQWWFGVPWRLLVLVHCVFYQVQSQRSHLPGDFGALYASICWQAIWRCWFPFPAGLSAHSAKTTSKWFADHDITVLDWPANMPDLNPIWNLWDIFKRKMRNSRSNNPDELKAQQCLSSATGWSLPCHTSMMLELVLKEPRPSIKCINEHTLKNLNFSVLQIFFFLIDLRKYSNILRYWIFDFHQL